MSKSKGKNRIWDLPQSKFWDCQFSLKEIVEKAPMCILNTKYKPHKSDNSYGLLCLYFPTSIIIENQDTPSDRRVFEIGITDDGFVYNGCTNVQKEKDGSLYIMDTKKAIEIMLKFQKLMISRDDFANELVTARTSIGITLREDCVNIVLSNGYELEKMFQDKSVKLDGVFQ